MNKIAPNPADDEQKRWQSQITAKLNSVTTAIYGYGVPLGSVAWKIAKIGWDCDVEAKGNVGIDESEVFDQLTYCSFQEIDEGLAQLSSASWINCWSDANSRTGCGGFHCEAALFASLDPTCRATSPIDDAQKIARFLLDTEDSASVTEIDEEFGWENRRLYPALWFLGEWVISDSCDKCYIEQYPFNWIMVSGGTRLQLRRFTEFSILA